MITFQTLQERLRQLVRTRIEAGQLSGLQLARQTGFQQAHISNFLNRKRGLSLQGLDRVMEVLNLSALDLVEHGEHGFREIHAAAQDFVDVPLVDTAIAATSPIIAHSQVRDVRKFKSSFLSRLRPNAAAGRRAWRRFVLIRLEARDSLSMYPRAVAGATLLIDRHYNSLCPLRPGVQNVYAVRKNGGCVVRYLELSGNSLVLRPFDRACPVDVIRIAAGKSAADYIVGRVCHASVPL